MTKMSRRVLLGAGVLVVVAAATVGRTAAFHFLPVRWTGEASRVMSALVLRPGASVADIGAGDGELAIEVARALGAGGVVYATEMTEKQRTAISDAVRKEGQDNVRVVAAEERATGLPDACCDGIYLRNVLHHISSRQPYAADLRRTLKPGGRLLVIDFSPGTFFHLAGAHGIAPEDVEHALRLAGFTIERRVEEWGGGMFAVIARSSPVPST